MGRSPTSAAAAQPPLPPRTGGKGASAPSTGLPAAAAARLPAPLSPCLAGRQRRAIPLSPSTQPPTNTARTRSQARDRAAALLPGRPRQGRHRAGDQETSLCSLTAPENMSLDSRKSAYAADRWRVRPRHKEADGQRKSRCGNLRSSLSLSLRLSLSLTSGLRTAPGAGGWH